MLLKNKLSVEEKMFLRCHQNRYLNIERFNKKMEKLGFNPKIQIITDKIIKKKIKEPIRFNILISDYLLKLKRKGIDFKPGIYKSVIKDFHRISRELILEGHTINYGNLFAITVVEENNLFNKNRRLLTKDGDVVEIEFYCPIARKYYRRAVFTDKFKDDLKQKINNNKRYQNGNSKTCESTKRSI